MKGYIILGLITLLAFGAAIPFVPSDEQTPVAHSNRVVTVPSTPTPTPLPETKILENNYHVFQTFNNCGPAALSMALSYYDINISQYILGQQLRPYQIPNGDNDDKSVTLSELAEKAQEYELIPYHRPHGSIDVVKKFVANDIPVVTRTWLKQNEDIGHYRVVKGYDDTTKQLLQDDSLQGKNLWYPYDDFQNLWEAFNFEYLVLVPKEKQLIAETILGEDLDRQKSWEHALSDARKAKIDKPDSIYPTFNEVVALYYLNRFKEATAVFETIENRLSFRMLWYQIEPILAYRQSGNDEKVIVMTDQILNNHNRAFSELYHIRGQIYLKQGKNDEAKQEFEKAVFYNTSFKPAKEELEKV